MCLVSFGPEFAVEKHVAPPFKSFLDATRAPGEGLHDTWGVAENGHLVGNSGKRKASMCATACVSQLASGCLVMLRVEFECARELALAISPLT